MSYVLADPCEPSAPPLIGLHPVMRRIGEKVDELGEYPDHINCSQAQLDAWADEVGVYWKHDENARPYPMLMGVPIRVRDGPWAVVWLGEEFAPRA